MFIPNILNPVAGCFGQYYVKRSVEPTEKTAEPGNAETRPCLKCQASFPFTIEFFPSIQGKPHGVLCRTCAKKRRRGYEIQYQQARIAERNKRAAAAAAALPAPASAGDAAQTEAARSIVPASAESQLTAKMRAELTSLNEAAPAIVATILAHAKNPKHPLHEWALKFIADRVMPKKLFDDLGAQAAGSKAGRGALRPLITVVIQQTGPAPSDPLQGRVIDVTLPEDKERM